MVPRNYNKDLLASFDRITTMASDWDTKGRTQMFSQERSGAATNHHAYEGIETKLTLSSDPPSLQALKDWYQG
ncbi:hypothetical protein TNCV_3956881 [Trichonephila clavipes]|nr:hypothetical protein TNCV_3956881 [Trichonephila clavipes]